MSFQLSEHVHEVRRAMWAADFRPVPVETDGKAPFGKNWPEAARGDEIFCVLHPPVPHMLNTGLLCDGLRVIDIDIDVAEIASQVRALLLARLGPAPIRYREGSPRCALIYRAARGSPRKVTLAGTHGKIEVLGHGQQLVVHGRHPTGATLEWLPQPPWAHPLAELTEVTEETLAAVLAELAPLLGAKPPEPLLHRSNGATPWPHTAEEARVAAALEALANDGPADWDYWIKVGMATYAATAGSQAGFAAWDKWSAKHPDYDDDATEERWTHFRTSPPSQVGAHTLFWLAGSTFRQREQGNGAKQPEPPPYEAPPEDEPEPQRWPEPDDPGKLTLAFGAAAANPPLDQSTVVRGLFHKGSITLIYGAPKSGKSFLATNAALAVADPDISVWMAHRIQQHGPVLYVACEGHGGFWKRLAAVGHVPANFALGTGRPMLIRNADGRGFSWVPNPDDIKTAIRAVKKHYGDPPILVIIDTVFRSFGGGNVNDSSHMNAYVAAAQQIADRGAAVGLVHHTTKTGTTPAGSVALMGAADTLVLVEKREDKTHTWTVEEAKDDASGEAIGFRLEIVNGIVDASGEEVSSCVLVPLDEPPPPRHDGGRPPNRQRIDQVMSILVALITQAGGITIHIDRWREAVYREMLPGEAQDTKRKAFKRDTEKLIAQGRVAATGDMVGIPERQG